MSRIWRPGEFQGDAVTRFGCLALVPILAAGLLLWGLVLIGAVGAPPHQHFAAADFAAFWGAGRLVLEGRGGGAYDWPLLKHVLQQAFGAPLHNTLPIYYPPTFIMLLAPLGLMPYGAAFAVWALVGVALYLAAVWTILPRKGAVLVALAAPGVFSCLQLGQNGFLTAATLGVGLALLPRRPRLAGVFLGLLCCKPHLALLVPVALLAAGLWRTVRWAVLSAATTVLLAAVLLGPAAFLDFAHAAARARSDFAAHGWVRWCFVQTAYGMARAAGATSMTGLLIQGVVALGCVAAVAWVWRSRAPYELKAATLASAALLATPYVFLYDAVWLGVAAVFLLRDTLQRTSLRRGEAVVLGVVYATSGMQVAVHMLPAVPMCAFLLLAVAVSRAGLRSPFRRLPSFATAAAIPDGA